MPKFEEEFKALTSWDWVNVDLIQKILTKFGNWHSDEEFQELFDKYSNLNDNYEKEVIRSSNLETSNLKLFAEGNGLLSDNVTLTKEVADLKSQLQQQALPVVPECVARDIEKLKSFNKDGKNFHIFDLSYYSEESINWVEYDYDNYVKFYLAVATGKYEVEKPQLFYLRDELTGQFLAKDNQFNDKDRYFFWTGADPLTHSIGTAWKLTFTQAEIDSMQTGSYELVPVEDGE